MNPIWEVEQNYVVDIVYDIYHIIDNEGYFDDFAPKKEGVGGRHSVGGGGGIVVKEEEVEEVVVADVLVGVKRKAEEETESKKTKKKGAGKGYAFTEEENDALLEGAGKYGLDFKRIKEDNDNVLGHRTLKALKKRFRYKFPEKYKELRAATGDCTPRNYNVTWTAEEDAALKRGRKEHGANWAKIIKSENKVLGRRTLVALQRRYSRI